MSEIAARWEWRTFGNDFAAAEARIRAVGAPDTRQSEEVYIVSQNAGVNTKIRNEQLDIKELRQVDPNGLEQWYPVMKASFPLPPAEISRVCAAWKVEQPVLGGDELPYDLFMMMLVAGFEELATVDVQKTRHGFVIKGATVEIAELVVNGMAVKSICVEHVDPALVWAIVGELGLQGHENINYIKAIKRQLGWK